MAKDVFGHLQRLPFKFFQDSSTGELVYKLSNDVEIASDFICRAAPEVIKIIPRFLFILALLFYLNWKLTLLALILIPASALHPYLFAKRLKEMTRKVVEKSQGLWERLCEVFTHMHLVKALGKEKYEVERFKQAAKGKMDAELKRARLISIGNFSGSVLNKVIGGAIALYGGYQVIKGTMSLGSLSAIMIYFSQLLGLLRSAGSLYESMAAASVSNERLDNIFAVKEEVEDAKNAEHFNIKKGEIKFENVSFGYRRGEFVLKDLTFCIPQAAKVALVGSSGCGKTTLLSLILRLYDSQRGLVLIDAMDIKKVPFISLKAQIGVALQEPFLFNDTLGNNILYGTEGATREDLIKASKITRIHDFIEALPSKYDSLIGESACKISEGQKQRIALARAIIKRPKILILDEAFSSVDSETEQKIIDNIKKELKDSTLITVTHRLSTVEKMDMVYFLVASSKMEIATHDHLLAHNQRYRELFAGQLKGFKEKEVSFGVR
jgi:ABC-type multidrug transport system fused ATPase/permease subunit